VPSSEPERLQVSATAPPRSLDTFFAFFRDPRRTSYAVVAFSRISELLQQTSRPRFRRHHRCATSDMLPDTLDRIATSVAAVTCRKDLHEVRSKIRHQRSCPTRSCAAASGLQPVQLTLLLRFEPHPCDVVPSDLIASASSRILASSRISLSCRSSARMTRICNGSELRDRSYGLRTAALFRFRHQTAHLFVRVHERADIQIARWKAAPYGCLVRIYAAKNSPSNGREVVVESEDFRTAAFFFRGVLVIREIRSVFPTSGSELIPGNSSSHRPNVSASGSTTTCRISFSDAEAAIDLSSSAATCEMLRILASTGSA